MPTNTASIPLKARWATQHQSPCGLLLSFQMAFPLCDMRCLTYWFRCKGDVIRCIPQETTTSAKEGNSKAVYSLRTKRRIWLRNDNEKYVCARVRTLGCASIIKRFTYRQFLLMGCQIRLLIVNETKSRSHACSHSGLLKIVFDFCPRFKSSGLAFVARLQN